MGINSSLIGTCRQFGKHIVGLTHEDKPVDGGRLLLAIAGCESNYGALREFVRMEKGYAEGGNYYKEAEHVRKLWKRWGCLAASSYGTFQIMYVTATELGYSGHPIDLQGDHTCAYWAMQLIVKRFQNRLKAKTLVDVLDCYNSGYHKDQYIPTLYLAKGTRLYGELEGII